MFDAEIKAGRIVKGMNFNQKVWAMTARIPRGKVATYGDIARALGTQAYRAVGNALNKNPYAARWCPAIASSGRPALTGFAGGLAKKQRLLRGEGLSIDDDQVSLENRFKF